MPVAYEDLRQMLGTVRLYWMVVNHGPRLTEAPGAPCP